MTKHIILIGFKNAGKSAIGKELAKQIGKKFFDLDEEMEKVYAAKNKIKMNCRQIMLKEGQQAFRSLEHGVLKGVLKKPFSSVIALGGGTPIYEKNNSLLKKHSLIHITAPRNIIYERIMVNGRPAFFSPDEHPLTSFNRIWKERQIVYNKLSKMKVDNSGSIKNAIGKIKSILK